MERTRSTSFDAYRKRFLCDGRLRAVVSVFCDAAAMSPSLSTWESQLADAAVYGAFGIHPHNARHYSDALERRVIDCLAHPKAVALGECGLDYGRDASPRDVQRTVFERQLLLAVRLAKPVVIHSRNADDDTLAIMQRALPPDWRIHLHCFTSSAAAATRLLDAFPNLCIGVTGFITHRSSSATREAVKSAIPLSRLLLETDAPYMAPATMGKGALCHPTNVAEVAAEVAAIKGVSPDEVAAATTRNACALYGFSV
jgi:TatD DNase family protein